MTICQYYHWRIIMHFTTVIIHCYLTKFVRTVFSTLTRIRIIQKRSTIVNYWVLQWTQRSSRNAAVSFDFCTQFDGECKIACSKIANKKTDINKVIGTQSYQFICKQWVERATACIQLTYDSGAYLICTLTRYKKVLLDVWMNEAGGDEDKTKKKCVVNADCITQRICIHSHIWEINFG